MPITRTIPTDEQKAEVWRAYYAGRPIRPPVRLGTNPRVVLEDPDWNHDGLTFEDAFNDPKTHIRVALLHMLYCRRVIGQVTDEPHELPEVWDIGQMVYNVYEAAGFGAPVQFPPGQVPVTEPIITDDNKRDLLAFDPSMMLEEGFFAQRLKFWHEMRQAVEGMTFEGRPVRLMPWDPSSTDGPLTVACNLRGGEFLMDMMSDDPFADELLDLITRTANERYLAFERYWGDQIKRGGRGIADDSCEMLGADFYRQRIMPYHRRLYEVTPRGPRSMHLCGDVGRLLPVIHEELNVVSFDTGFPLDHAAMRRELGPDVELIGGPEVALLVGGTPEQVYARTREILASGVCDGGRFVLREANNLPPCVPLPNLRAMYEASLDMAQDQP